MTRSKSMSQRSTTGMLWVASLLLAAAFWAAPGVLRAQERSAPARVATLLPFVADALALAPEHATVVASVRRSMRSPLPEGLIDLGNPHSPSFERLAEARPDLIVGDRQIHAALRGALSDLGAELVLIDTTGADSTLDGLLELSRTIGGSPSLTARVARVRAEVRELAISEPIRVLVLFGAPGSFYAVTERAWLGELVRALGFQNLAPTAGDERFPGMVVLSDEVVAALDPELVLLVAHGAPQKIREDLESRTRSGGAWSSLGRARRGIHVLDPALFSANPGLELARAARLLVAFSHEPGAIESASEHAEAKGGAPRGVR